MEKSFNAMEKGFTQITREGDDTVRSVIIWEVWGKRKRVKQFCSGQTP